MTDDRRARRPRAPGGVEPAGGLLGAAPVGAGAAGAARPRRWAPARRSAGRRRRARARAARPRHPSYPFFGAHQAGITTPVQDHLHFASFDMMARTDRDDLVSLLQDWSYAASRMTQGLEVSATGAVGGSPEAPPDDTGEALGPAGQRPDDHVRLRADAVRARRRRPVRHRRAASRRARAAAALPRRRPRARRSDGDLCVQACADDPQVAVHAIRNLSRIAFGRARLRWSQLGFGRTSKTTSAQQTPRNLFGFKDGTSNILAEDTAALDEHVWVAASDARRGWPAARTSSRARSRCSSRRGTACGSPSRTTSSAGPRARARRSRAATSSPSRTSTPTDAAGAPVIARRQPHAPRPPDAQRGHPDPPPRLQLRRRQQRPRPPRRRAVLPVVPALPEQFIQVQRSLSTDILNEYIRHIGSGIWAVPPGASPGSYVGAGLFA